MDSGGGRVGLCAARTAPAAAAVSSSAGYDGLLDRRRGRPSPRRAPVAEVQRVVRLYRRALRGLQRATLPRDRRREARGEAVVHVGEDAAAAGAAWSPRPAPGAGTGGGGSRGLFRRARAPRRQPPPLAGRGTRDQQTLIAVVDDATKRLLYAQLVEGGRAGAIMTALRRVLDGTACPAPSTPIARAGPSTPRVGLRPRSHQAHPGRPRPRAARHRAHPGALPPGPRAQRAHEPHPAGPPGQRAARRRDPHPARANRYLTERFLAATPRLRPRARRSHPAFVPVGASTSPRSSATRKNASSAATTPSPWTRSSCRSTSSGAAAPAPAPVLVRRHLDGRHSVWWGPRCFGRFPPQARPLSPGRPRCSHRKRTDHLSNPSGQLTC